jgi:hypothetical protein
MNPAGMPMTKIANVIANRPSNVGPCSAMSGLYPIDEHRVARQFELTYYPPGHALDPVPSAKLL